MALFDDSKITEIDTLVFKIDTNKKLKTKILKETLIPDRTTSENNTLTAFLKNRKIQKVVYNQYFAHGGGWFTTIYFDNERPVYVEFVQKVMYGSEERFSKLGCYIITGSENSKKVITKKDTGKKALIKVVATEHYPIFCYSPNIEEWAKMYCPADTKYKHSYLGKKPETYVHGLQNILNNVDFPEPVLPKIAKVSPFLMVNEMLSNAVISVSS